MAVYRFVAPHKAVGSVEFLSIIMQVELVAVDTARTCHVSY